MTIIDITNANQLPKDVDLYRETRELRLAESTGATTIYRFVRESYTSYYVEAHENKWTR